MKLHVAHDQHGRILGAAEVGPKGAGDKPVAKPGTSVAEMEVPKEFADKKLSEFMHHLHVDVGARKLVSKR
jgi:hypothetical protein